MMFIPPADDQPSGEYLDELFPVSVPHDFARLERAAINESLNTKLAQAVRDCRKWYSFFRVQNQALLDAALHEPAERESLCETSAALTRAEQIAGVLMSEMLCALREQVADILEYESPGNEGAAVAAMIRNLSL